MNGTSYTNANLYICELERIKALKQIMILGKRKAYFEDNTQDNSNSKLLSKRINK